MSSFYKNLKTTSAVQSRSQNSIPTSGRRLSWWVRGNEEWHPPHKVGKSWHDSTMNKTDYNRFEITYLTDNTKFADQKASLLIGLDGLLLKAVVEFFHSAGVRLESLFEYFRSIGHFSVIAGACFLIIGIIMSLAVVFPRRGSAVKKGFVFWGSIVSTRPPASMSRTL